MTFERAADLDTGAVSGRTLGQRATKVRVNNDGEHIREGPRADPFVASNGHFGTKQSALSF